MKIYAISHNSLFVDVLNMCFLLHSKMLSILLKSIMICCKHAFDSSTIIKKKKKKKKKKKPT